MRIDPTRTWAAVEAAWKAETNPRHKSPPKPVRDHMKTEMLIASGGNLFEFNVERIIVDDHAVITEGRPRSTHLGEQVLAAGVSAVKGAPVEAAGKYVSDSQRLTVWPAAADGRLIGEDIYFGSNPFDQLERLAPVEEPAPVLLGVDA